MCHLSVSGTRKESNRFTNNRHLRLNGMSNTKFRSWFQWLNSGGVFVKPKMAVNNGKISCLLSGNCESLQVSYDCWNLLNRRHHSWVRQEKRLIKNGTFSARTNVLYALRITVTRKDLFSYQVFRVLRGNGLKMKLLNLCLFLMLLKNKKTQSIRTLVHKIFLLNAIFSDSQLFIWLTWRQDRPSDFPTMQPGTRCSSNNLTWWSTPL